MKDKDFVWVCPVCKEVYYGWSKEKKCRACGCREEDKEIPLLSEE